MSLQDLLSDFVARVNNAAMVDHETVSVLKNRVVTDVCKKLTSLGYLTGFEDQGNTLLLSLNLSKIQKLQRVSKPGQRIYVSYKKLPRLIGGIGFYILSTSKGILTNIEAKRDKSGGELLFSVY